MAAARKVWCDPLPLPLDIISPRQEAAPLPMFAVCARRDGHLESRHVAVVHVRPRFLA